MRAHSDDGRGTYSGLDQSFFRGVADIICSVSSLFSAVRYIYVDVPSRGIEMYVQAMYSSQAHKIIQLNLRELLSLSGTLYLKYHVMSNQPRQISRSDRTIFTLHYPK